jgi:hypothetical protein
MPSLSAVLFSATVALYLALAIVLARKYLRTRDIGFLWLGAAVVIWPLVSRLLDLGEHHLLDRILSRKSAGFYPFNLVAQGQMTIGNFTSSLALFHALIGAGLLLIAALYLYGTKSHNKLQSAA